MKYLALVAWLLSGCSNTERAIVYEQGLTARGEAGFHKTYRGNWPPNQSYTVCLQCSQATEPDELWVCFGVTEGREKPTLVSLVNDLKEVTLYLDGDKIISMPVKVREATAIELSYTARSK